MSANTVPALAIEGVAKSFGGLKVLSDVSVTLGQGECLGLIGPNGAGKTTLFNIVTGFLIPDHGRVAFAGEDITRAKPDARVRAGLVRTFQKSMAFPELSVRENLALAARSRAGEGYGWFGSRKAVAAADQAADELLTRAPVARSRGTAGRRPVLWRAAHRRCPGLAGDAPARAAAR
jgi:branched-chain amino acid transport system ATP-binding protein